MNRYLIYINCSMYILYNYLSTNERCLDATTIIVYTNGCTYQNRCTQLSNALLFYAKKLNKIVYKKYLVRGHTQMEVDSCHALIERTSSVLGSYPGGISP